MRFGVEQLPTRKTFLDNLKEKKSDRDFFDDIDMVLRPEIEYNNNNKAYDFICKELFERL